MLYECGANFWSQHIFGSSDPHVPTSIKALEEQKRQHFHMPTAIFPGQLVVALSQKDEDPSQSLGAWRRVSPDEPIFAAISAVAEQIRAGIDDATLLIWRKMFLCVSVRFEHLPTEEARHFRAHNLRQAVVADYDSMAHSDIQQCFSLKAFQLRQEAKMGAQSAQQLWKLYNEMAKNASLTEPFKVGFIDACLTVWDKILLDDYMRQSVLMLENEYGKRSPLNSIYKMQRIVDKAKTHEQRCWLINGICDWVVQGLVPPADFTFEGLVGKGKGDKGFIDLLLLKFDLLSWFATRLVHTHPFTDAVRDRMGQMSTGHAAHRAMFGTVRAAEHFDQSWLGALPPSGQALLRLTESIVFKTQEWDMSLKTWLRAGKTWLDILEEPMLKESISKVLELLSQEVCGKPGVHPKLQDDGKSTGLCITIDDILGVGLATDDTQSAPHELQQMLLEKDPNGKLLEYRTFAATLRNQFVKLIEEPQSAAAFSDTLLSSALGQVLKDLTSSDGYVGVMYYPPAAGEPITHPHLRISPLRDEHLKKLVKGVDFKLVELAVLVGGGGGGGGGGSGLAMA